MAFEHYVNAGGKKLRLGFTTGVCAAIAAGAALEYLLGGEKTKTGGILTPRGIFVETEVFGHSLEDGGAACSVRKDGGDDIDVTSGAEIRAAVFLTERGLTIDGGQGVGRVTKGGLDQPVGQAAINAVPRAMIGEQVEKICKKHGYAGGVHVIISVPEGERLAKKTFNPNMGIEGGISILGTSGIVEPKSLKALLDSIGVEMRVHGASGAKSVILTPGNYGEDFLRAFSGIEGIPIVKCSNFIGDTLDMAAEHHMERVLVVGHMGKLVKLAGGVMNTHSRYADCRGEIFTAHGAMAGISKEAARELMSAPTADGCMDILKREGIYGQVVRSLLEQIQERLERRAAGAFAVGAVVFSNQRGLIGMTAGADRILRSMK